jgi:hypothetical protein
MAEAEEDDVAKLPLLLLMIEDLVLCVLFPLYVGVFIGSREEVPPHGQSFFAVHSKTHLFRIWKYLHRLAPILKGGFILIFWPYLLINYPYTFQCF